LYSKYKIIGIPLIEVQARFIIPCRFGDDLCVETGVTEWGRSSLTVQHRLLRHGELAVEGVEKRVWAAPAPDRPGGIKSRPVPAEVITSLSDPTGSTNLP
jgi:4-hydroxybenzoyl-CoA thioesterase